MKTETQTGKFQFWITWTLLSFVLIPIIYFVSLIAVLLVHGAFGFNMTEGGTYLSQTLMQMAGGAVIGFGVGLFQKLMLKKVFPISNSWLYALIAGFVLTELFACLILWQLQLNRWQLRFIEFNPLPEALIFACAGLLTGLLQWTILRKYFSRTGYWILASTTGWGLCILMTYFVGLMEYKKAEVFGFFPGTLLYGALTGAALMWILRKKEAV